MEHSDCLYKDNGVGGVMLRLVGWQPQLSAGFEHTLYVPSCAYMHALLVSLPRYVYCVVYVIYAALWLSTIERRKDVFGWVECFACIILHS